MKINIIIGTTREGRASDRLAQWVRSVTKNREGVEFNLVDLREHHLPLLDEAIPPMGNPKRNVDENVQGWLDVMNAADGYVFVTAEYNHGLPTVLKNAIDLLDFQLQRKPSAIVSHGSVGGARAAAQLKTILNSNLGGVSVPVGLPIAVPPTELFDEAGSLKDDYKKFEGALKQQLDELLWYAGALKTAREN